MAIRYIGDLKIEIKYHDAGYYFGKIHTISGYVWKFSNLKAKLPYAYDSPQAYDRMAKEAVGFASYYTSLNREDAPAWAPSPEVADAINEESYGNEAVGRVIRP
jgi:hypothetical protein